MTQAADPPSDTVAEARRAELESLIEADPSHANYAAYARWLSDRGDRRGELMSAQLAAEGGTDEARERARAYARRHRNALGPRKALEALGATLRADWRLGFWDSVTVGWAGEVPDEARADALRVVLAHPAARFLRRLDFAGSHDLFEPGPLRAALSEVSRARRPVRALSLVGPHDDRPAATDSSVGFVEEGELLDTAPIAEALPALEALELSVLVRACTALPPGLRSLSLHRFIDGETYRALANVDLRTLEALEVCFMFGAMDWDRDGSAARALFNRERLPALRVLALARPDRLPSVLPTTDILRGLTRLALSGARLQPDVARALADCDALDSLATLELSSCTIGARDLERFRGRPFDLVSRDNHVDP